MRTWKVDRAEHPSNNLWIDLGGFPADPANSHTPSILLLQSSGVGVPSVTRDPTACAMRGGWVDPAIGSKLACHFRSFTRSGVDSGGGGGPW